MSEDAELLRRYVAEHSEEAFAELVQRHLRLVYRAALRQVGGDAHQAEEVSQLVFTVLARKAATLLRHPSLAGWLHTTTHLTVCEIRRADRRRQKHEQEAQTMHELSLDSTAAVDWDRVRPVLDEVLQGLNGNDREAILLRFFEERPFAQIGVKLALSEDAARMRVDRALDRLRGLLARRGLASTAAALALMLATEGGAAVPAGLAASVTGSALSGAAAAATLGGGTAVTLKFLSFMGTAKATVVAGAVALLALGGLLHQTVAVRQARAELTAATTGQAGLKARLDELQQRVAATDRDNAALLKLVQGSAAALGADADANLPITRAMVEARYQRARDLAKNSQLEPALKEFLWCYDIGMPRFSSFSSVRTGTLAAEIERLGQRYPEALAALQLRADQARQQVLADAADDDALADFGALNHTLKEDARTMELYEQLPANDARRRSLAIRLYDQFIEAQRYADAIVGRSYAMMSSQFEVVSHGGFENQSSAFVASTARNVEVLAGSGDLAHARELAARLLAYSGSETTRALVQQHLERAGHPELLMAFPKP